MTREILRQEEKIEIVDVTEDDYQHLQYMWLQMRRLNKPQSTTEKSNPTITVHETSDSDSMNLQTHLRTHTAENPTSVCSVTLLLPEKLKWTHTWENTQGPHKCNICETSYIHGSNLMRHKCCICGITRLSEQKCKLKNQQCHKHLQGNSQIEGTWNFLVQTCRMYDATPR